MDILDHDLIEQQVLLTKYKKRIKITQVIIFLVIGLLYFSFLQDTIKMGLLLTTLILIINVCCFFWPRFCLAALFPFAIAITCVYLYLAISDISAASSSDMLISLIIILTDYFLVRGFISAIKLHRLKRNMVCEKDWDFNKSDS